MFKFVVAAAVLAIASAIPSLSECQTMFENFTVKVRSPVRGVYWAASRFRYAG